MCSYSLDPITLISQSYLQGMCLVFHQTRYAVIFQFDLICIKPKSKVHFDAIKNLLNVASGTVCTKPLRMCSFR